MTVTFLKNKPKSQYKDGLAPPRAINKKKKQVDLKLPPAPAGGYRPDYLNTIIPGFIPLSINPKSGKCEYSEEQLQQVADSLPHPDANVGENHHVNHERLVAKVEELMIRGLTNQELMSDILGLKRTTVGSLIRAVYTRWEGYGGKRKIAEHKGEALQKLRTLETEYWNMYHGKHTSGHVKILALNNLMQLVDRTLLLHGLTPKALEEHAKDNGELTSTGTSLVEESITLQESLSRATKEALQLIANSNGPQTDIEDATYSN